MKPATFSWGDCGGVCADSELVAFVDESGNTGGNYLDPAQPYYVTAGWLLRQNDAMQARMAVSQALAATSMRELKGSQMMKARRGREAALPLVLTLLGFCTPVLVVIEKRFGLCSRVVEEFFYYPGGPFFGNRPDRDTSRELVTVVASLPPPVLFSANSYMAAPSSEAARGFSAALDAALRDANEVGLAGLVRGSANAPAQWWNRGALSRRSLSPNVTGFTTLLQMLEILGLECGQQISLMHDELPQLQDVYEFYQEYAATLDQSRSVGFFEQAGCPGRVDHVVGPSFASSREEPLIQAADVLCAVTTSFLTQLARAPKTFTKETAQLAVLLLWGFVEPDLRRYFTFIGLHTSGMRFGQILVDKLTEMRSVDDGAA